MDSLALFVDTYQGRELAYSFLSQVFLDALNKENWGEVAEKYAVLHDMFIQLGISPKSVNSVANVLEDGSPQIIEQCAVEYSALFEAHKKIYPFASCWEKGKKPVLLGKPATEALTFYSKSGFEMMSGTQFAVDHIGTEMQFLSLLAQQGGSEFEVVEAACKQTAVFLENCISPWVFDFFRAVYCDDRASFYASVAQIAEEFIQIDRANFTEAID